MGEGWSTTKPVKPPVISLPAVPSRLLSFVMSMMLRQATWELVVHPADADDVFSGEYFCVVISYMVSWVASGIELCQFL